MKAIVDCNSFYCSCERVFRPDLRRKPVVVLSNNDGCIISISDEAKKLGISMATPYHKSKDIIDANSIAVFSSNYNLYGDMSRRVMLTLKELVGEENIEVYSVDEAFLDLDKITGFDWKELAMHIKQTVEDWTGIEVSVGIAPTKVLAKMANKLSKKNKQTTKGVMVLETEEAIREALLKTPVGEVWGIGGRYAFALKEFWNIYSAYELSFQKPEWAKANLGGVVGIRLLSELNGVPAIGMKEELKQKKMIATTRMFGYAVSDLKDIKEAVATYTARAAEKLRRQFCAAATIGVFLVKKEENTNGKFSHGTTVNSYYTFKTPTAITSVLIKPAVQMTERLYETDSKYRKAGVMLSGLVLDTSIQASIFEQSNNNNRWLMEALDNINFSMRDDIVKYATSGTDRNWKMQKNFHSPRYTTRWNEMREVK